MVLSTRFYSNIIGNLGDDDDGDEEEEEEDGEKEKDGEGEGEEKEESPQSTPSWSDYIMHFLCVPWKLICAFIPPTGLS